MVAIRDAIRLEGRQGTPQDFNIFIDEHGRFWFAEVGQEESSKVGPYASESAATTALHAHFRGNTILVEELKA